MTQKIKISLLGLGFIMLGIVVSPSLVFAASPLGNGCKGDPQTAAGQNACLKNNPVVNDIQTVVNFLSAGVAVVIAGSIIVAGIQYVLAGNQPQALTNARNRIINSVVALFAFLLTFAFLQWLIPGGIFS